MKILTWVKYHYAAKGGEQVQYYKREDGVNSKIQIFIFSLQIILLGRQWRVEKRMHFLPHLKLCGCQHNLPTISNLPTYLSFTQSFLGAKQSNWIQVLPWIISFVSCNFLHLKFQLTFWKLKFKPILFVNIISTFLADFFEKIPFR